MTSYRIAVLAIAGTLFLGSCSSSNKATSAKEKGESIQLANLDERKDIKFKELFFNANKEKMLGNHEEAANLFIKALEIYPDNDAAYFELSMIRDYQNNLTEAIEYAEKAVDLSPNNKWYLLILSEFYRSARDYEQAISVYQTLATLYPNNIEYPFELASLHIMNNDLKSALKVYNNLEGVYGLNPDISKQKKEIYLQLDQPDKAIDELKKLIKAYPADVQYYSMLAEVYGKLGKTEDALNTYKKIKELDPDNPYVQLSLVDYYANAGDMERSNQELKVAFSNPKLDVDTKVRILMKYYEISINDKSELDLTLELNEIVVNTHPDSPQAKAMYGDFLYRERMFDKAKVQYEEALALDQSRFLIWNQLLIVDSELNDFRSMASRSKKAIDLFPIQPTLYYFNGVSNLQLKNYEDAINSLEAGKELVVDNDGLLIQFYASLGDAYFEIEKYTSSYQNYDKALAKDPNNPYVLNNYSYFLSLSGDNLQKAKEMAEKANILVPNNISYLDTYAWVLFKMGNYEEAKKKMDEAFSIGGKNNGTLLEHYGDIQYKLGFSDKALDYWKKAMENGPDNNDALQQKIESGTLDEN